MCAYSPPRLRWWPSISLVVILVLLHLCFLIEIGGKQNHKDAAESGHALELSGAGEGGTNEKENVFLFIGVLSRGNSKDRRDAVREAYAAQTYSEPVAVKFILDVKEQTREVQKEQAAHGDLVFAPLRTNYDTILFKVMQVRWAMRMPQLLQPPQRQRTVVSYSHHSHADAHTQTCTLYQSQKPLLCRSTSTALPFTMPSSWFGQMMTCL